jgi:hypothetical protein
VSYADRVHSCDQCGLVAHAEEGELLPDTWIRTTAGAVYCSTRCEAIAQGRPVPRADALRDGER